ncbi:MAG: hypothetical protein WCS20_05225, partial [Alphaproteobacteria bacterium]
MKPSFALDFRDGSIALLHRTSRGWQQVGVSPLDAPDLGDAVSYMRSTALGLSPRGLSTKLVIPNDLILYTTVHAPGPEVAKRRRQIKVALEGLTPYKIDDLVFDWWGSGPEVQVAVVARETLVEAEAFATEHRLNPVSFVGAPENAAYLGEPFFGPSVLSATLLGEGEKVERDQDPVTVVARDTGNSPTPDAAPERTGEYLETAAPAPAAPAPVVPVPVVPVPVEPYHADPAVEPPSYPLAEVHVETTDIPSRAFDTSPPPIVESAKITAAQTPMPVEPDLATGSSVQTGIERADAAKTGKRINDLPDFSAGSGLESAATSAAATSSFDPAAVAIDLVDEAPMALDVVEAVVQPPELPRQPP